MGPTLFCTRVPCFVGIPGAPDLSYQGSLEGNPADAQSETGHSQGVAGAAVSPEGLTKGGCFQAQPLAGVIPPRPENSLSSLLVGLSIGQLTAQELGSFRARKQDRADHTGISVSL